MSKITHKAINFDLDTNALKEYYPKDFHKALDESDRQADIFKSFGFNDEAKTSQTKIQRRL